MKRWSIAVAVFVITACTANRAAHRECASAPSRCAELAQERLRVDDLEEAEALSRQGCDAKDAFSCAIYAQALWSRAMTPAGFEFAADYGRYACELGHVPSCIRFGQEFEYGFSMSVDLDQARTAYGAGCVYGSLLACQRRSALHGKVIDAQAIDWERRACELGDGAACDVAMAAGSRVPNVERADGGLNLFSEEERLDVLRRHAQSKGAELAVCFEHLLRDVPSEASDAPRARVVVDWVVGSDGRTRSADALSSSPDERVGECVAHQIFAWSLLDTHFGAVTRWRGTISFGGSAHAHSILEDLRFIKSEPPCARGGTGGLSKDVIAAEVARRNAEFRACYNAKLFADAEEKGRLDAKWWIDSDGLVRAADDACGELDPALAACLLGRIGRFVFPPPACGVTVEVTYPFIFKREGGAAEDAGVSSAGCRADSAR